MSERYWLTGVQLGMLVGIEKVEERMNLADDIINTQFTGNVEAKGEEMISNSQMNFIKKLKSEGKIPDDLDASNFTMKEAHTLIAENKDKIVSNKQTETPSSEEFPDY